MDVERAFDQTVEFAPYGSGSLWIDGERKALIDGSRRAALGEGERVLVSLARGPHVMTVSTCAADGYGGFYLLHRGPGTQGAAGNGMVVGPPAGASRPRR